MPTARQVSALFLRRPAGLTSGQRAYLERLHTLDPVLGATYRLTQDFATLVRERQGERLDAWLTEAAAAECSTLWRFAASWGEDRDAVRAGVTERWSNGPTEGFVYKLTLVKRHGYGRAGVALLRRRLLDVASPSAAAFGPGTRCSRAGSTARTAQQASAAGLFSHAHQPITESMEDPAWATHTGHNGGRRLVACERH